jgi:hypothetical protein
VADDPLAMADTLPVGVWKVLRTGSPSYMIMEQAFPMRSSLDWDT